MKDKTEMRDLRLLSLPVNISNLVKNIDVVSDLLNFKTVFGFNGEDQIEIYGYKFHNAGTFGDDEAEDDDKSFYIGNLLDIDVIGNIIVYRIIIDRTLCGSNLYRLKWLAENIVPFPVICGRFRYLNNSGTIVHSAARMFRIDFMIDDRTDPFVFDEVPANDSVTTPASTGDKKEESSNA